MTKIVKGMMGPLILLFIMGCLIFGPMVALFSKIIWGTSAAKIWQQLTQPLIMSALRNSLFLGLGTIIGTTVIATPLAVIMTRTKMAKLRWLHWMLLVPFMTPPYINAMGWIYFFQPSGLFNQLIGNSKLSFNWLFSPFGIILIMSLHLFSIAYLPLKSSLEQFNQRWTQVALIHGISPWRRFWRITFPLLLAPYLTVWGLVFMKTLAEFGTPATFGRKIHFTVLTTAIQQDLSQWPLDFKNGVVTGGLLLVIALFIWMGQQALINQHAITLSAPQSHPLATSKLSNCLAAGFISGLLFLAIGIPYFSIIMQSLMRQRSLGIRFDNWSLSAYLGLLRFDNPAFQAIWQTLLLSFTVSLITLILATLICLTSTTNQKSNWLQRTIAFLGSLPLAIPNVVLALSLIIFFVQVAPLTHIYGTPWILLIADIILFLPTSVQYLATGFKELDSAAIKSARIFESRSLRIIFRIFIPLLLPALINSFVMTLIATSRELVMALLLVPSGMTTTSTFIFQSFEQGDPAQGMALAVVSVAIMLGTMWITSKIFVKNH